MEVYAWGSNKYGQLSSKKELHIYTPTLETIFEGKSVAKIAAGDNHTLVLTDFGDVYSRGRGQEGQLGHGSKAGFAEPTRLTAFGNENIVDIACGSLTSFAVTDRGELYQWGLVHTTTAKSPLPDVNTTDNYEQPVDAEQEIEAASGQLTGMAVDQDVTVPIDEEARRATDRSLYGLREGASRQLRDIVRESTERWMLATDGADEEYLEEMRALGYQNEEVTEMMHQRGREYHGMLRLGCKRTPITSPMKVRGLEAIQVAVVAAGFAHCVILSQAGHLYSAGYNDRGQLGLGHRISTSSFKWVDYLAGKFVVQVSCGQQHTVCRALDKSDSSAQRYVGSRVGADVYSWGNGMLGQLGLGRRGTSKGRLLPTLISRLTQAQIPTWNGAADIAAGHNFSVCVSVGGQVYSWGHAEYNQHGTGGLGDGNDLAHAYSEMDAFYFYEPREVHVRLEPSTTACPDEITSDDNRNQIVSVTCGSTYTIARDRIGNLYSWGWNEAGVLGHGIGHFNSTPVVIRGLAVKSTDRSAIAIAAGAKHVLALALNIENSFSRHLENVLRSGAYADALIRSAPDGECEPVLIPCHRIILACRSSYLRGYLLVMQNSKLDESSDNIIDLSDLPFATAVNMRIVLEYIYLDSFRTQTRINRKQLLILSDFFCLHGLSQILTNSSASHRHQSTFSTDLTKALHSPLFADVSLTFPKDCVSLSDSAPTAIVGGESPSSYVEYPAHRVVLSQIGYFEGLFQCGFNEVSESSFRTSIMPGWSSSGCQCIVHMGGFLADGLPLSNLLEIISMAYGGSVAPIEKKDFDETFVDTLQLLITANMLCFAALVSNCERKISDHLRDNFPEVALNCLTYAKEFGLARLERNCIDVLRIGGVVIDVNEGDDHEIVVGNSAHERKYDN